LGFNLLFNYKISKVLRAFSSLVFLAPILFDGNLQYFFFLMFSQTFLSFSLTPKDKIFNVLSYLLYFAILWLSIVSCFLAFYINKKLTKYILDNWRTRVYGLLAYSLTNAVRMLIFGAVHSLLRSSPLQLPILMFLEVIFSLFLFLSLRVWLFHKVTFKIWLSIAFSMLRLCLQIILCIQQAKGVVGSGNAVEEMIEGVLGLIVLVYIMLFLFATGWEFVYELI